MACDYSSKWFAVIGNHYTQMKIGSRLWDIVNNADQDLYVWGRGKRGMAFEKLCSEKNIRIAGVCDRNNTDIGRKDEFGNRILDTKEILKKRCVLVASNKSIYMDLMNHIINGVVLVNLEEYCPL